MESLLEAVEREITPRLRRAAVARFEESEESVSGAITDLAERVLRGVSDHASDSAALDSLYAELANERTGRFLEDLPALVTGGNIAHGDPKDIAGAFLGQLFGASMGKLLEEVAQTNQLSKDAAGGLLGLVGPLVMGVLHQRIAAGNLSAEGLQALLEKPHTQGASVMGKVLWVVAALLGFGALLWLAGVLVRS